MTPTASAKSAVQESTQKSPQANQIKVTKTRVTLADQHAATSETASIKQLQEAVKSRAAAEARVTAARDALAAAQ